MRSFFILRAWGPIQILSNIKYINDKLVLDVNRLKEVLFKESKTNR